MKSYLLFLNQRLIFPKTPSGREILHLSSQSKERIRFNLLTQPRLKLTRVVHVSNGQSDVDLVHFPNIVCICSSTKLLTIEIVDINNVRTMLISTLIDNSIVDFNNAIIDIYNSNCQYQ